ncbi:MAG: hypothetical protein FWH41_01315, partial [Treponema sp.]|nr:hypothetical protein [Treponema sp.]
RSLWDPSEAKKIVPARFFYLGHPTLPFLGIYFSAITVKLHRWLGRRGSFFQNFVLKKAVF